MTLPDDPSDDPRVRHAAREYLAELEAGRDPDRAAYLARHPDMAGVLADCLDGIKLAHAAGRALNRRRPPAVELPAEPLGDFRIVREVGRGGMGVVYEAVQLSLGRRVALKVLPFAAALDGKQLQRFRTEAHAAAQLHHTNIVPVYAVGCERGVHFYAMQLIPGRPLDAVLRELRGPEDGESREESGSGGEKTTEFFSPAPTLPVSHSSFQATSRAGRGREAYRTAARIAADVADALDYAHDAGVIHRDIKPANLLLDAKGGVWVTDFGLAQIVADPGVTRTGDVVGTLRYMSPEQAAGRRAGVDHRTDVYSLGATLYELLTLEPIFPGQERQAVLRQVLHDDPRPPRRVDRGVPEELETIVLKAVAKVPEDRYATAGELAADLRRFLDDRPILARRPSPFDRGRKWLRRHPAYARASAVMLVFGVIGLAASTALIGREKVRTDAALGREKERAAEAEGRFQLARRSVDELIRIADEELGDGFGQQTVRRRLLDAALQFYQEFIELRRDDPDAQADLEATRDRVQAILADLAVLRGGERHALLRDPDVQAALGLTREQRDRLEPVFRTIGGHGPPLPGFGSRERVQRLLDEMKVHEAAIKGVLTAAQFRRLGEITLQYRGPAAFRDPDVAAALGLTREQRAAVREIDALPPFPPGGFGGFGPPGNRGDDRRPPGPFPGRWPAGNPAAGMSRALALLTPEQRARWREMTGEPFRGTTGGPSRR